MRKVRLTQEAGRRDQSVCWRWVADGEGRDAEVATRVAISRTKPGMQVQKCQGAQMLAPDTGLVLSNI